MTDTLPTFVSMLGTFAAVAVVFCALTGIGTLPARLIARGYEPGRLLRLALFPIAGWGLVAFVSAATALADLDQTWLARGFLALGLLLLLTVGLQCLADLVLLLVLVAPMGIMVAGVPATAFDDFIQWLPNTRYLVEHAHYWQWPDWIGVSSKPGYPNGSSVVGLLADQMAGPVIEAPFKTFTVILLGAFGAVLAELAALRFELETAGSWSRRIVLAALLAAGILVSFVDPFVDPRVSLSAHPDTSTALILAVTALIAVRGIEAARQGAVRIATGCFAWAGLLALTLVMLRTTNVVLVAGVAVACALLLPRPRAGGWALWIRWALSLLVPAVAGVLLWNAYLHSVGIGPDMVARPPAAWDWTAPATVARAFLLDRLGGNPVVGAGAVALVLAVAAGGILLWRRLDAADEALPPPRLVVSLAAIVGAAFVGFLAWSYAAVFSPAEVAAAASLWRYLTELGPMVVLTAGCVLLALLPARRWVPKAGPALVAGGVAAVALLLLPYGGRGYYDLACRFPDVIAARRAVADLRPALEPFASPAPHPARIAVVHPTMGDWMAFAMAFDLHWPGSDQLVRFRVKDEPLAATEAWAWDEGLDAVLDLRPLDRAGLRAKPIAPPVSVLGRPQAAGEPWQVLATSDPDPLPACSPLLGR